MEKAWGAQLAIGGVVGLLLYFMFPGKHNTKPITTAVLGVVGGALGALLAAKIMHLSGDELTPSGLMAAAIGAFVLVMGYITMSF